MHYANRFKHRAAEEFGVEKLSPFQKALGFGLWGLFVLLIAAFALSLMSGCAGAAVKAHAGQIASAGLSEDLSTAHSELSAAVPHTDPTGKAHLQSADAAITAGTSKLPAIDKGLAQVAPLEAENHQLKTQFFSPRQRGLALVIGLSVAALLAGASILYFATPFGAPIGVAAAGAFHLITLGVPKIFSAIVSKIETNVTRAKAGTPAAPLVTSPPATSPPPPSAAATPAGTTTPK